MKLTWAPGALALLCPLAAFADPPVRLCALYKDQVKAIQALPKGARQTEISAILSPDQHAVCIASELAVRTERQFFKQLEADRTDKQAGASAGGGGGTSLVSKGVTAKALSVADEYGALTQSVSGQIVTVKGSLDGVPRALIRGGLSMYCLDGIDPDVQKGCIDKHSLDLLGKLSYSVSFDTSRANQTLTGTAVTTTPLATGAATPVNFTPTGHQISAISGRFELWNHRDQTSTAYLDQWAKAVQDKTGGTALRTSAADLLASFGTLFPLSARSDPAYVAWFRKAADSLQRADNVEAAWSRLLNELLDLLRNVKDAQDNAAAFLSAVSRYDLEQDALIAAAADKPVFTIEYANNRPIGEDSDSTFRFIFDKGFGSNWSFTSNGAIDFWDRNQSTASTKIPIVRDVQAGAEIDYKLTGLGKALNSAATLSGAYYFQYQHSAILLKVDPTQPLPGISFSGLPAGATMVLADTGSIHIGQLKLLLGAGSTSMKIPISVTYSNRTELIAKPAWRAQVGLSYDFDSLFAK